MGMPQLKGRRWHVQGAVAIKGEGLYEVCGGAGSGSWERAFERGG